MPRKTTNPDDFSNSIGMLHNTVTDMRSEMRATLKEGFDGVTAACGRAHRQAAETVNAELNRMRADLRASQKGVLTREDIGDVQRTLDLLRDDVQAVKRTLAPSVPPVLEAEGPQVLDPVQAAESRRGQWFAAVTAPSPETAEADTHAPLGALGLEVDDSPEGADSGDGAAESSAALPSAEQIATTVLAALREELQRLREPEGIEPRLDAFQEAAVTTARELAAAQGERESFRDRLSALADDIVALPTRQEISEQITVLRAEIAALAEGLRTAGRPPLGDDAVQEPTLREEPQSPEAHRELLRSAARVSAALLVCHRDTWEFLTSQAARHPHFRMPPQITDHGEHRIAATLSGRSLIAALITLHGTRHAPGEDDGDWALAATTYDRIAAALGDLAEEGGPVTITLDDRTPASLEPDEPDPGAGPAPGEPEQVLEADGDGQDGEVPPDTGQASGPEV